jgi:hypothetical protein
MDGRHHRADRDVQIVFVEVPEAGNPRSLARSNQPIPHKAPRALEVSDQATVESRAPDRIPAPLRRTGSRD